MLLLPLLLLLLLLLLFDNNHTFRIFSCLSHIPSVCMIC